MKYVLSGALMLAGLGCVATGIVTHFKELGSPGPWIVGGAAILIVSCFAYYILNEQ